MKKIVFVLLIICIFFLSGCFVDKLILKGETEIIVGETVKLYVETNLKNPELIWTSSNLDVLIVEEGLAMALKTGEARVTVQVKDKPDTVSELLIEVIDPYKTEKLAVSINSYFLKAIPEVAEERVVLPYSKDIIIKKSIVYPNTVTQLRPGDGTTGKKMPGGIKYIVIHDTGMGERIHTAAGVNRYIHEQANSPTGRVASWHYTIDDKEAYQHVPDDEIAWHAGDGSTPYGETYYNKTYNYEAIGGGNQNGIGIETCINDGGNYQLTLIRTAKLVAQLLIKHNLEIDAVKQHHDFSGKGCPNIIRRTSGLWEYFLKHVEVQLMLLKAGVKIDYNWEIDDLNVISIDGKINSQVINDSIVNIKLLAKIGSLNKVFNYQTIIKGMTNDEKMFALYKDMYANLIPRNLSNNIELPTYNELYDVHLEWSSDKPEILNEKGEYNKPDRITSVILYVKMTIGENVNGYKFVVDVA